MLQLLTAYYLLLTTHYSPWQARFLKLRKLKDGDGAERRDEKAAEEARFL